MISRLPDLPWRADGDGRGRVRPDGELKLDFPIEHNGMSASAGSKYVSLTGGDDAYIGRLHDPGSWLRTGFRGADRGAACEGGQDPAVRTGRAGDPGDAGRASMPAGTPGGQQSPEAPYRRQHDDRPASRPDPSERPGRGRTRGSASPAQ